MLEYSRRKRLINARLGLNSDQDPFNFEIQSNVSKSCRGELTSYSDLNQEENTDTMMKELG